MVDLVPGHSENMTGEGFILICNSPCIPGEEKMKMCRTGYSADKSFPRRVSTTTEYNALSLSGLCQVVAHFLVSVLPFAFVLFSTSEYPLVLLLFFAYVILYVMVLGLDGCLR